MTATTGPANVARAALDVLKRDGWCKNDRVNDEGQHCVLGALDVVCGVPHDTDHWSDVHDLSIRLMRRDRLVRIVDAVAREQFADAYEIVGNDSEVWPFNDDSQTTFADVELVLEKAALKIDEAVQ